MAKKTAEKTAVKPKLIPQAHGGALLTGGVLGNKGGGREKDWHNYLADEICEVEGLEPGTDAYLKAMAQLAWKYAKDGKYEALRDMIERKFGKIPDINVQIKLQRTEIVHKVGDALSQALLQNGISKETAVLVVDDMETIIEGGEA